MGIFYFPSQFVYWKRIKNHKNFKDKLLNIIDNNISLKEHALIDNGVSTYNKRDENGIDINKIIVESNKDIIDSVVWETLDSALKELNDRQNHDKIDILESRIIGSWISLYDNNGTVDIHNHESYTTRIIDGKEYKHTFSMIYILKDDNERNQTVFLNPQMCGVSTSKILETKFDTGNIKEIGEGTVLVFPSNLYHYVKSITKPGRIVLSFNIMSLYH